MAKPARKWAILALIAPCSLAGCAFVPRSQLEECHRVSRGLETETSRLKDSLLTLRNQNHDLSQRAVDDAQRISQLEEVNQGLQRSVVAYQKDRDRIASGYDRIKSQLQDTAPAPAPARQAARD